MSCFHWPPKDRILPMNPYMYAISQFMVSGSRSDTFQPVRELRVLAPGTKGTCRPGNQRGSIVTLPHDLACCPVYLYSPTTLPSTIFLPLSPHLTSPRPPQNVHQTKARAYSRRRDHSKSSPKSLIYIMIIIPANRPVPNSG